MIVRAHSKFRLMLLLLNHGGNDLSRIFTDKNRPSTGYRSFNTIPHRSHDFSDFENNRTEARRTHCYVRTITDYLSVDFPLGLPVFRVFCAKSNDKQSLLILLLRIITLR
jgi:hypothetical protein